MVKLSVLWDYDLLLILFCFSKLRLLLYDFNNSFAASLLELGHHVGMMVAGLWLSKGQGDGTKVKPHFLLHVLVMNSIVYAKTDS